MSGQPRSLTSDRALGEHAATLAASWWRRRAGQAHAQSVWQMLADAARLGVIRHGQPEVWAAGAVVALARVSGLIGAGRSITAQQVAADFGVSLGAASVAERELAGALHMARYATKPTRSSGDLAQSSPDRAG